MRLAAGDKVTDAMREIAAQFVAAGVSDSGLDARRLVEAATGLTREQLVLEPRRALSESEARLICELARRRLAREPVSRILGQRHFYGRRFEVTADTLDPRPDTETLIELALEIVAAEGRSKTPIDVLDIGTGSGCILLTLLAEMPCARGVGLDISPTAVEVARRNADALGVADRAAWRVSSAFADMVAGFDLVVSNPPYIPQGDIAGLDPEVRLYDPMLALDGGPDGLDVIRDIVAASIAADRARGTWFILEVGVGQATAVLDIIRQTCGDAVAEAGRVRKDLGGHSRCVAWKPHI